MSQYFFCSEDYMDGGNITMRKYVLYVLGNVDFCQVLEDWRETMAEVD